MQTSGDFGSRILDFGFNGKSKIPNPESKMTSQVVLRDDLEHAAVFGGDLLHQVDDRLLRVARVDEHDRVDLHGLVLVQVADARQHRVVVREVAVGQQVDEL